MRCAEPPHAWYARKVARRVPRALLTPGELALVLPARAVDGVPSLGVSVPAEPPGRECPLCRGEFDPRDPTHPESEWHQVFLRVREVQEERARPKVPPVVAGPPPRAVPGGDRMVLSSQGRKGTVPGGARDLGAALRQAVGLAKKFRDAYEQSRDDVDALRADVRRLAAVEAVSKVAAGGIAGRTALDDLRNKAFASFYANIQRAPAVRHVEGTNQAMLAIMVSAFSDWKLLCYAPPNSRRVAELRSHVTHCLSDPASVEVLTDEGDEADYLRAMLLNAVAEATLEVDSRLAFLRSADKTVSGTHVGGWKDQLMAQDSSEGGEESEGGSASP